MTADLIDVLLCNSPVVYNFVVDIFLHFFKSLLRSQRLREDEPVMAMIEQFFQELVFTPSG